MAFRITRKVVEKRFERWLEVMGLTKAEYVQGIGFTVGTYSLDHNSVYGGYQVERIFNTGGAIGVESGPRKTGAEMLAWLDGGIYSRHLDR
jgi:hypothetical protein